MIKVQDSSGAGTKDNLKISQVTHASVAQKGPRFNTHWGNILLDILLSHSKASNSNVAIIANFVCL